MMRSLALRGGLLLNVVSSVAITLVNKRLVYMEARFNFSIMLTIIHFIASFVGCLFFERVNFFTMKPLNIGKVFPISMAFCCYVVFNNLSLLNNTVSVYQTSKILCTPVIVLIERVFYDRHETKVTFISLVLICLGVTLTVFCDAKMGFFGSLWAILAVIANSLYTIWGKTKQQELDASPMQLLLYQAPLSAFVLFFALPFDNLEEFKAYEITFATVWTISLSCILAFCLNFSFFLFVGQTSPLTVNVIGYLKTALVFIGGFVFISSDLTFKTFVGVLLTLLGLAFYTYSKVGVKNLMCREKEIV